MAGFIRISLRNKFGHVYFWTSLSKINKCPNFVKIFVKTMMMQEVGKQFKKDFLNQIYSKNQLLVIKSIVRVVLVWLMNKVES